MRANGPSPADFYIDQFDDLASGFANGIDAEDLDEARAKAASPPKVNDLDALSTQHEAI